MEVVVWRDMSLPSTKLVPSPYVLLPLQLCYHLQPPHGWGLQDFPKSALFGCYRVGTLGFDPWDRTGMLDVVLSFQM